MTREESGGTSLVYRAGLEFGPMSATEAGTLGTFVSAALRTASRGAVPQPGQTVAIRFPHGWAVSRKQGAVVARAPDAPRFIVLGAPLSHADHDLGETARCSMQDAGFDTLHGQATSINGLTAWVGFYTGRLHDFGVVIVEAAHVILAGQTFLIAGVAPWAAYETVRHDFFAAINSFGSQSDMDGVQLVAAPTSAPPPACSTLRPRRPCRSRRHQKALAPMTESRRKAHRVTGPFDGCRLGLIDTPLLIYDLSEGGCFVNSLHDTPVGQRISLRLTLPYEGAVTVKAETVYSRPGFGFAVRFIELSDETRACLQSALDKLRQNVA